jgi:hypothetical protein
MVLQDYNSFSKYTRYFRTCQKIWYRYYYYYAKVDSKRAMYHMVACRKRYHVCFITVCSERNVLHPLSRMKKILCVIDLSKMFKIIILKMESKIGERIVKGRRRLFPCFLYHMLLQHRKQRPCHQMRSQCL